MQSMETHFTTQRLVLGLIYLHKQSHLASSHSHMCRLSWNLPDISGSKYCQLKKRIRYIILHSVKTC